ncbi:salicylate carboxymethyltransferase-like [Salvia miltiorrhiza]|uniref:salicylate carboxymethyltransferase-like n=1 Tax=Salvia miltiorrhiza TaxID=226208 RepID=UPI0025ACECA9|nr:salicylate carboxymethyltransferase-like [Salvia miltiorrhiza]
MEVEQVLHMNGGLGDSSYANNSLVQGKMIEMTKPIVADAISKVYRSLGSNSKTLCMAELGCSSGPNTLLVAAEFVKTVYESSRKHGRELPEFQIFLNDLPGNDFNCISQWLMPKFEEEIGNINGGYCFVYGAPGSFYGRLFPSNTLHFVHSSCSLMWLSKVPQGLEMNKGNVYIGSESPVSVSEAYYAQFRSDFQTFLKCRSEEVVVGGRMVLTILGRKTETAASKECCYIWELLALALKQMVHEGVVEEEIVDSFNIPQYTPSPIEVKKEVENEGSFIITHLEASEISWAACSATNNDTANHKINAYNVAKCMRSVAEPLLVQHFGQSIIDQLFVKYQNIIWDRMSKEDTKFINVTISMTKRQE